MQIDEKWIDCFITKGLSPHAARQSVTQLRAVKSELDDEAFGIWLATLSLPDALELVATFRHSPPSEAHTGQVT